jgi:hypothetical protein
MMQWRFSNSHAAAYAECQRKAFYRYYYDKTGIVPVVSDVAQDLGTNVHLMLSKMLEGKGIEDVIMEGRKAWTGDSSYESQRAWALAEGLARGYYLVRLPALLEEFEILATEEEEELDLGDGIIQMIRIDGKMRRKSDDSLWALEFKTTGTNKQDYIEGWRYSNQSLTHLMAIDRKYGKRAEGVRFEFLYKGYKQKDKMYSPFVKGDIWQSQSMPEIIANMPEDELYGQFFSKEVFRSASEEERWNRQTVYEQMTIAQACEDIWDKDEAEEWLMDTVFRGKFSPDCYSNKYYRKCEYLDICYGIIDDIEGSGRFKKREPHHQSELLNVE